MIQDIKVCASSPRAIIFIVLSMLLLFLLFFFHPVSCEAEQPFPALLSPLPTGSCGNLLYNACLGRCGQGCISLLLIKFHVIDLK